VETRFDAVIVPHAGWAFSGRIAYATLRALRPDVDTVIVAGGHLRPSDPVHVAPEERYETPFGALEADVGLAGYLETRVSIVPDMRPDNTVEVHLPIVHYLFPQAQALYLRCPPSDAAASLGHAVAEHAGASGKRIAFVGSTDLTHYGPAYGFVPHGVGEHTADWVREENDRRIVEAMMELDAAQTIRLALEARSACSSGAAAAAISFARHSGCTASTLVEYAQSYDVRPDTSFVGYAGIGFAS
jgi:AmmeMemoRadiSam system protein B